MYIMYILYKVSFRIKKQKNKKTKKQKNKKTKNKKQKNKKNKKTKNKKQKTKNGVTTIFCCRERYIPFY
jgi:hypothetical protein